MKNVILSFFVILGFATQSFAEANGSAEAQLNSSVLAALVGQSSQIKLVGEDGKAFQMSLSEMIAGSLMQNYASHENVLSATSVSCKNVTPKGLLGASQYDCMANFMSGDFDTSKDGGLVGPSTESSYYFNFKASKVVVPGAKPKITSTSAIVHIAG